MIFNIKKIASVIASTVMLGSTVALAAAANYPSPFVKSGAADVAVVYGSNAAQTDLVASIDVTADLQAELAKQTATTGSTSGTSVSGGDYVTLAKSSDKMNLNDEARRVFGATVSKDDLKMLLADGVYSNDENTEYKYEQKLTLGSNLNVSYFADSDYKDETPTVGIKISNDAVVLNYTLDFTTDAESDVSSGDLVDLETTDLKILGKSYYILDAKNNSNIKLTLLDSANTALVTDGETQTVTVGDKSYQVAITYIDTVKVKLDVNGEVTNSLGNGGTYKLSDGTYVGVKEILARDITGNIGKVEISLGTGKLELESGSQVELNDDAVDNIYAYITRGTASSGREKVDKITIEWKADDEQFITPDSGYTMPGFGALKISMGAFFTPVKEITKVNYEGDDNIKLEVPIKDGTAKFDILYANSTGDFQLIGKDATNRLSTSGNSSLVVNESDQYFVASYATSTDSESYLLSATVDYKDNKNKTIIKNEVTGDTVCEKAEGEVCNIGDVSITIGSSVKVPSKRTVFNAGTNVNFHYMYTATGMRIALPIDARDVGVAQTDPGAINFTTNETTVMNGHNRQIFNLTMWDEDKDDNIASGRSFSVTVGDNTDGKLHITDISTGSTELETPGTDDNVESMVDDAVATKVFRIVASDKGRAEVEYHGSESYTDVFLTDTTATVSAGEATGGATGTVVKLGSVAVSDAEAASVATKNLIVVGGSCVNSVAASLLGGALCGADFEAKTSVGADSFLIETFSRDGGKVATLVAGYNAADTTNAAKYLTTQVVDTTVGKKYKGTSATSATLVTAQSTTTA